MDYQLIDTGEGEKLERFGAYVLRRPDPQALWERRESAVLWETCDARYERRGETGRWRFNKPLPQEWPISYGGFSFLIRPTSFKHVGLFPEQIENWEWIQKQDAKNVLNLFAYTGGSTMASLKDGASVTHVDASKIAVEWARANVELSRLTGATRFVVEDAMKYVDRELKRGSHYDGIVLDPPAFGHGPKNELWKIERDLVPLIKKCFALLSDTPRFVLITGYAAGYSHLAFEHLLEPAAKRLGGTVTGGELTIKETTSQRLLPAGIFARWSVV